MKTHSITTLTLLGLTGLVWIVGCQWSGRTGGFASRRTPGTPVASTGATNLSNQQVADMNLALGRTLEQQKEYERALDAYAKAAELDPKLAAAAWRQGVVCDKQGRTRESEAFYKQALKLSPRDPDLLCDFGYSLYLQRRWAEAEEQFGKALAEAPRHPRAHCNLGLVLAQTDRTSEALAQFQQAGCDRAAAQSNLGLVLAMNNRLPEAKTAYATALAAQPKSKAARRGMELIAKVEQRGSRGQAQQVVGHPKGPTTTVAPALPAPVPTGVGLIGTTASPGTTPVEPAGTVIPAGGVAEQPEVQMEPVGEEREPARLDSGILLPSVSEPNHTTEVAPPAVELAREPAIQAGAAPLKKAPQDAGVPSASPTVRGSLANPRGLGPRIKRVVQ